MYVPVSFAFLTLCSNKASLGPYDKAYVLSVTFTIGESRGQKSSQGWRISKKGLTAPVVDGALVCHCVEEHQEHPHGAVGIVRSVRPEAVYPAGDAESPEMGR